MKLFSVALPLAVLAACFSALVSAQFQGRLGAYYEDTNCGSGVGHEIDLREKSPIKFNVYQGAKSARIDHKTFTIYKDADCTKEPKTSTNGGCARYSGELIQCLKY